MSNSLDQLARNLASGMSRRKALWQFVSGLGVVAALTGRKAFAGNRHQCEEFCEEQAEIFKHLCIEASKYCKSGHCAEWTLIGFNGTIAISGDSTLIGINGGPFVCVPVKGFV
jgi:hypothetical protein